MQNKGIPLLNPSGLGGKTEFLKPKICMDKMAGLEKEKAVIRRFMLTQFRANDKPDQPSVLCFSGMAGTGKSAFAVSIADKYNLPLMVVHAPDISSKWTGRAGEKMKQLFEVARQQPCIILIDEAEELFHQAENESQGTKDAKSVLKNKIEGVCEEGSGNILMILTANRPWEFPIEIRSRVWEWLFFELPSKPQAFQFIENYRGDKKNMSSNVTANELAVHFGSGDNSLKYFSFRDLARFMEEAKNYGPRDKMVNSKHLKRIVTQFGDMFEPCNCSDPFCPHLAMDGSVNTVDNVLEKFWKYPPLSIEDLVRARQIVRPVATETYLQELHFFRETRRDPRSQGDREEVLQIKLWDYLFDEYEINMPVARERERALCSFCYPKFIFLLIGILGFVGFVAFMIHLISRNSDRLEFKHERMGGNGKAGS